MRGDRLQVGRVELRWRQATDEGGQAQSTALSAGACQATPGGLAARSVNALRETGWSVARWPIVVSGRAPDDTTASSPNANSTSRIEPISVA